MRKIMTREDFELRISNYRSIESNESFRDLEEEEEMLVAWDRGCGCCSEYEELTPELLDKIIEETRETLDKLTKLKGELKF